MYYTIYIIKFQFKKAKTNTILLSIYNVLNRTLVVQTLLKSDILIFFLIQYGIKYRTQIISSESVSHLIVL